MALFVKSVASSGQQCFSKISMTDEPSSIDFPFPERQHKVVGYCKGLFCLQYENGRCLVWNPSRNEFKFLPPSELKIPRCPSPDCPVIDCVVCTTSAVRGLGYDPISGDYKVVRFTANFYNHARDSYSIKQVEVYSLIHDSWEEIGTAGEENYVLDECATYLDGRCYWLGHSSAGEFLSIVSDLIISLDLSTHEFSTLRLPPRGCGSSRRCGLVLAEFENSLAFIQYLRKESSKAESKPIFFSWVRGVDGEWVEQLDFRFNEAERPLGFCGDSMLFQGLDGSLLLYDLHNQMFRKLDGIQDFSHWMRIFPCIKSKVRLTAAEKKEMEWSLIPHKRKEETMKSKRKRKRSKAEKEGKGKETMKSKRKRKRSKAAEKKEMEWSLIPHKRKEETMKSKRKRKRSKAEKEGKGKETMKSKRKRKRSKAEKEEKGKETMKSKRKRKKKNIGDAQ